VRLEGLGQLRKSSDLIGNRTRDLPAGSIVRYRVSLPDRDTPATSKTGS
jgi:hypothetical protein